MCNRLLIPLPRAFDIPVITFGGLNAFQRGVRAARPFLICPPRVQWSGGAPGVAVDVRLLFQPTFCELLTGGTRLQRTLAHLAPPPEGWVLAASTVSDLTAVGALWVDVTFWQQIPASLTLRIAADCAAQIEASVGCADALPLVDRLTNVYDRADRPWVHVAVEDPGIRVWDIRTHDGSTHGNPLGGSVRLRYDGPTASWYSVPHIGRPAVVQETSLDLAAVGGAP